MILSTYEIRKREIFKKVIRINYQSKVVFGWKMNEIFDSTDALKVLQFKIQPRQDFNTISSELPISVSQLVKNITE